MACRLPHCSAALLPCCCSGTAPLLLRGCSADPPALPCPPRCPQPPTCCSTGTASPQHGRTGAPATRAAAAASSARHAALSCSRSTAESPADSSTPSRRATRSHAQVRWVGLQHPAMLRCTCLQPPSSRTPAPHILTLSLFSHSSATLLPSAAVLRSHYSPITIALLTPLLCLPGHPTCVQWTARSRPGRPTPPATPPAAAATRPPRAPSCSSRSTAARPAPTWSRPWAATSRRAHVSGAQRSPAPDLA